MDFGDVLLIRKPPTLVLCQRFVEFIGNIPRMLDQRIHNRLGVLTWDLQQHHIMHVTLDQRGDVRVL
jgi:hypothetical protein